MATRFSLKVSAKCTFSSVARIDKALKERTFFDIEGVFDKLFYLTHILKQNGKGYQFFMAL